MCSGLRGQVLEEARDSANTLSVRARDAHRAADAARLQLESISQQGDVRGAGF